MASGTADLQRDLGGALMTSIFGALLTAGYAAAMGTAIAAVRPGHHGHDAERSCSCRTASAVDLASQYPAVRDQIIAAAQSSFLGGDQLAYYRRPRRGRHRRRARVLRLPEEG